MRKKIVHLKKACLLQAIGKERRGEERRGVDDFTNESDHGIGYFTKPCSKAPRIILIPVAERFPVAKSRSHFSKMKTESAKKVYESVSPYCCNSSIEAVYLTTWFERKRICWKKRVAKCPILI